MAATMTAEEVRAFRGMTRDYVERPDPVSWLAAADLLEEAGAGGRAAVWRRRAEWFPAVAGAWWEARQSGPGRHDVLGSVAVCGPFLVSFHRLWPKTVEASAWRVTAWPWICFHNHLWRTDSSRGERYGNEKVLRLVDLLIARDRGDYGQS